LVVRELITLLGFKADDKAFAKYEAQFVSLAGAAGAVAAAVGLVGAGMIAAAFKTANVGDEALHASKKLNTTVDSLLSLRHAVGKSNVSAEELGTSLKFLGKNIEAVRQGNKGQIDSFKKLNPSILKVLKTGKNVDVVFSDVSKVFQNMPNGTAKTALAMELFGRAGDNMIPFLNEGPEKLRELRKQFLELGLGMSQAGAKRASKFQESLKTVYAVIGSLTRLIGDKMIQVMQPMIDAFLEWWKVNKEIVKTNIVSMLNSLVGLFEIIWAIIEPVVNILSSFFDMFGGIGNVLAMMVKLLAIFLAFKALVAFIPLLILALINDITTFATGGESIIGLLVDKVKELFTGLGTWFSGWVHVILDPLLWIWDKIMALPGMAAQAASFLKNAMGFGGSSPSSSPTSSSSNITNGGNVRVNAPIRVSVPEGTPAGEVGDYVQKGVSDGLSQVLRQGNIILTTGIAR
jgi:hypothetical protein